MQSRQVPGQVPSARVHDLKHTFGHRLVALDAPYEVRQLLLGHTPLSVTSHYSLVQLAQLARWAEKVVAAGAVARYMERVICDDWDAALREDRRRGGGGR